MTPSGGRNPRHRRSPTSTGGWPARPPKPADLDRRTPAERHLAEHPTCQWQRRMVRCAAEATDVVRSREGVLRSSCDGHLLSWLRTGARPVA